MHNPNTARWPILALAVALTLSAPCETNAQDFTLFSLDVFPAGSESVDGGTMGGTSSRLSVGFAYPTQLGRIRWINGARYQRVGVDFQPDTPGLPALHNLQYIRYDARIEAPVRGAWTLGFYVTPGLASDFSGSVSGDDVHVRGSVYGTRPIGALTLGLGVIYRSKLDSRYVPLIQLVGPVSRRVRLNIVAPSVAQVMVKPNPNRQVELGLTMRLASAPYHVEPRGVNSTTDGVVETAQYRSTTVASTMRFGVHGRLGVSLDAGYALQNRFKFSGPEIDRSIDVGSGFFFRTGILFSP